MLNISNILLAHDFSTGSERALDIALQMAERTGATLHIVFAEVLHGEPYEQMVQPANSLDQLRERLKETTLTQSGGAGASRGVHIEHAVVRNIAAGTAILDYAEEHDIDLIVMGTHGRRGMRHLMLGSVATEVVRLARCPVLTVRTRSEAAGKEVRFEKLLVPIDFSDHAGQALQHACALAGLFEARIDLLHVVEDRLHPAFYGPTVQSIYDVQPDIEEKALAALEELYEKARGPEQASDEAVQFRAMPGVASQAIAQYAEENDIDLIVMSTHGRTGLDRFFMGSVAEKTVRLAPCPVFIIKSFGKSLVPPQQ